MKEPDPTDAYKCFEFRCRSRRGEDIGKEGHDLCRRMFKKFPEWYKKTEPDVFNATVPFGSNVRMDKDGNPYYE